MQEMRLVEANTREQIQKIRKLYEDAFPKCEKKPFWLINRRKKQGLVDIWELQDEEGFAGLAIMMKAGDLVLLDYFAVDTQRRGSGCGSKALQCLQEHYEKQRLFLEIESVYGEAENQKDRERRKKFYLTNDMEEMGILVDVFGTEMELLTYQCSLTYEEYLSVYRQVYGERKAGKLKFIADLKEIKDKI
ncbi:MAG: GNAT family N-acetyltransferase [Lachnospiraceae bacterium]|nr:GNAT family N-acetyltransferase [Lachnospiraceae bacterium]MDY3021588.1 GNAT family N-acetyltransferase [Oliverpabstia sp.]MDY4616993.1 GNAT family N-acetyltransferase [Lachnospiraceae bacterium]